MRTSLLSLADASRQLGLSVERVRQLVIAGDLPGVRFGNAWAVPSGAVLARQQAANRRGRPLAAKGAWEAIARVDPDLSNVSRYRNRGKRHRFSMSVADASLLVAERGAVRSGVDAAIEWGEPLAQSNGELDLYLSADTFEALGSSVVVVGDALGPVVLRVVPDAVWSTVQRLSFSNDAGSRRAPRAAVALDLMESGDPRHWVAAENLIAAHG